MGFVDRFRSNDRWHDKIAEYEDQDKKEHKAIMDLIQEYEIERNSSDVARGRIFSDSEENKSQNISDEKNKMGNYGTILQENPQETLLQ